MTWRNVLILGASGLGLLVLATTVLFSHSDTARAQVLTCDVARDGGVLPRCIEVIKQTVPDGAAGSFTINYDIDPPQGANVSGSQNLQDGGSFGIPLGSNTTPAGTVFTFTENVPSGWHVTVSCEGAGISTSSVQNGIEVTYNGNDNPFSYGQCTFTNEKVSTSTPTSTPTATSTPTTATPTPTQTPVQVYDPFTPQPNRGGIFQPAPQPTKTPVTVAPPATNGPVTSVRPPSTGDGGLK